MRRAQASRRFAWLAATVLAVGAVHGAAAQMVVRSPDTVRNALATLNQVVADSAQVIVSGTYELLPRESERLEAGLTTLQSGLGEQPAQARMELDALIAKARVALSAMDEAARSHNISMLRVTESQLAAAVNGIDALFPQQLRAAGASPVP